MKNISGESLNITEENIKAVQKLFPEAFEEGKIDFDVLKQLLGDFVDDEEERYSFKWNGKGKALRLSQTPSLGTLRPCKEESKNWDKTENLYIEGDNLEVLKLLQKSYYGKVKMIYIDPPYNTGGDFVYKDDFRDNIENYKRVTGQLDGQGHKIDTNTESNGRFHTDWLNMMYPRLRLARNLLSDDGVIFISIDDNEQENLKKICDEVFGADNFIAQIIWQKKTSPDARMDISAAHDYILTYAKNSSLNEKIFNALPYDETRIENYKNPDNDPRGKWASVDITGQTGRAPKSQFYEITTPSGKKYYPPEGRCWAMAERTFKELYDDNRLWFGEKGDNRPRLKKFLSESEGQRPWTWWDNKFASYNQASNKEVMQLFDGKLVFDNPKPIKLLYKMLFLATSSKKEDIVLDFFSGSGTIAEAIMNINCEDEGNRRYICVQIQQELSNSGNGFKANEVALQLGLKNICEIGKERIRRAGEKIKAEAGENAANLDIGFKVFKLDTSNLKKWNPQPEDIMLSLQESVDNFMPGRSELDVVYEILLKMGLPLTLTIEEKVFNGETIYIIGGGALMICLGENITLPIADEIAKLHKEYDSELWQVVFRDTGFASDMDKTNIKETLKTAGLDEDSFVCL